MSQPDIPPELAEFGGPPPGFEGFAGGPPPGFDGPPPGVDGAGSPIIDPDRPATSRIPPFVPAPPPDFFFPEMSLAMFGTMLVILQRMLGFYIPALKRATSKTNVLFALAACVLSLVYVLVNLMYLVYGTWLQWGCYPRSYITAILFGLINVSLWAHVIVRSRRAFRAGTAAHLLVYAVFGLFIAGFAGVVIFEIVVCTKPPSLVMSSDGNVLISGDHVPPKRPTWMIRRIQTECATTILVATSWSWLFN